MDQQELFDTVVAHARKQGRKSEIQIDGKLPRCVYRGCDGLKCFMGALIEDREWRSAWEGMDIMMVLNDYRCPPTLTRRLDLVQNTQGFLQDLQNIHDCEEVKDWESHFQGLAQDYDLKYTAP